MSEEQKALDNTVALRKESVDRNSNGVLLASVSSSSLSARRAWIEISDGIENLS